ncbi:hypothetical protein M9458_006700, partial [Cirrhinus mrigala]
GDRSLEEHTMDFVFYANQTHYPDSCLCTFYQAGLNIATRAQLHLCGVGAGVLHIANDHGLRGRRPAPLMTQSPAQHHPV